MGLTRLLDLSQGTWALNRASLQQNLNLDRAMPGSILYSAAVLSLLVVLSLPLASANALAVTDTLVAKSLLVTGGLSATGSAPVPVSPPLPVGLADPVRPLLTDMSQIGDQLLLILPVLHAENLDRAKLSQNMRHLAELLDQAQPHLQQATENYSRTYQQPFEMLQESLAQAVDLAGGGNLNFVKSSLTETFELCAACHTQDKQSRRILGISKISVLDEFLAGEYSYLTRDYDSALVSFTNVLDDIKSSPNERSKALNRILIIEVEVKGDLEAGIDQFELLRGLGKGGEAEQAQLGSWIEVLRQVQLAPKVASPLKAKNILVLDRFLSQRWPSIQSGLNWHGQTAYWMVIRGELNRLLRSQVDTAELPRLYYWLAVSDRSLNYQFFDSLSRRYLEQCIQQYPTHAYSQKCLEEYEALVTTSFSGSGGTFVPMEVQQRLDRMRDRVKHPPQ
jgi:soluble cytochrome b562